MDTTTMKETSLVMEDMKLSSTGGQEDVATASADSPASTSCHQTTGCHSPLPLLATTNQIRLNKASRCHALCSIFTFYIVL